MRGLSECLTSGQDDSLRALLRDPGALLSALSQSNRGDGNLAHSKTSLNLFDFLTTLLKLQRDHPTLDLWQQGLLFLRFSIEQGRSVFTNADAVLLLRHMLGLDRGPEQRDRYPLEQVMSLVSLWSQQGADADLTTPLNRDNGWHIGHYLSRRTQASGDAIRQLVLCQRPDKPLMFFPENNMPLLHLLNQHTHYPRENLEAALSRFPKKDFWETRALRQKGLAIFSKLLRPAIAETSTDWIITLDRLIKSLRLDLNGQAFQTTAAQPTTWIKQVFKSPLDEILKYKLAFLFIHNGLDPDAIIDDEGNRLVHHVVQLQSEKLRAEGQETSLIDACLKELKSLRAHLMQINAHGASALDLLLLNKDNFTSSDIESGSSATHLAWLTRARVLLGREPQYGGYRLVEAQDFLHFHVAEAAAYATTQGEYDHWVEMLTWLFEKTAADPHATNLEDTNVYEWLKKPESTISLPPFYGASIKFLDKTLQNKPPLSKTYIGHQSLWDGLPAVPAFIAAVCTGVAESQHALADRDVSFLWRSLLSSAVLLSTWSVEGHRIVTGMLLDRGDPTKHWPEQTKQILKNLFLRQLISHRPKEAQSWADYVPCVLMTLAFLGYLISESFYHWHVGQEINHDKRLELTVSLLGLWGTLGALYVNGHYLNAGSRIASRPESLPSDGSLHHTGISSDKDTATTFYSANGLSFDGSSTGLSSGRNSTSNTDDFGTELVPQRASGAERRSIQSRAYSAMTSDNLRTFTESQNEPSESPYAALQPPAQHPIFTRARFTQLIVIVASLVQGVLFLGGYTVIDERLMEDRIEFPEAWPAVISLILISACSIAINLGGFLHFEVEETLESLADFLQREFHPIKQQTSSNDAFILHPHSSGRKHEFAALKKLGASPVKLARFFMQKAAKYERAANTLLTLVEDHLKANPELRGLLGLLEAETLLKALKDERQRAADSAKTATLLGQRQPTQKRRVKLAKKAWHDYCVANRDLLLEKYLFAIGTNRLAVNLDLMRFYANCIGFSVNVWETQTEDTGITLQSYQHYPSLRRRPTERDKTLHFRKVLHSNRYYYLIPNTCLDRLSFMLSDKQIPVFVAFFFFSAASIVAFEQHKAAEEAMEHFSEWTMGDRPTAFSTSFSTLFTLVFALGYGGHITRYGYSHLGKELEGYYHRHQLAKARSSLPYHFVASSQSLFSTPENTEVYQALSDEYLEREPSWAEWFHDKKENYKSFVRETHPFGIVALIETSLLIGLCPPITHKIMTSPGAVVLFFRIVGMALPLGCAQYAAFHGIKRCLTANEQPDTPLTPSPLFK